MQTKLSGGKSQISTVGVHTSHGPIGTFSPSGFYPQSLLSSEMTIFNLSSSNANASTVPLLPSELLFAHLLPWRK